MDFKAHLHTFLSETTAALLLEALQSEPVYGVRLNPHKLSTSSFLQALGPLPPHPYVKNGFYYDKKTLRLGQHPWHHGGAFYLQEPAAMMVAELAPLPTTPALVIDLAAAPGGKTTHLSARVPAGSCIIAHEYDYERSSSLAENIERWGLGNVMVTTGNPHLLKSTLEETADLVLLDAPCSGEGMFRKLAFAESDWSIGKVESCARLQHDLLDLALDLVHEGGYVVYSTCTFNPQENEAVVQQAIASRRCELVTLLPGSPLTRGTHQPESIHLYPHEFEGEGHFIALLRKTSGHTQSSRPYQGVAAPSSLIKKLNRQFALPFSASSLFIHEEMFYAVPERAPALPATVGRRYSGIPLGEFKGDDFIPHHALAMAYPLIKAAPVVSIAVDDPRVRQYLKGESFHIDDPLEGWVIVTADYVPLGWGKVTKGQLKNKLPKGWRLR